jgi:ketopantoate reductase
LGATVPEPGAVEHVSGGRLILGEPDGSDSKRLNLAIKVVSEPGQLVGIPTPFIDTVYTLVRLMA